MAVSRYNLRPRRSNNNSNSYQCQGQAAFNTLESILDEKVDESKIFNYSKGAIVGLKKFNTQLQEKHPFLVIIGYHKVSSIDQRPYYIVEHLDTQKTLDSLIQDASPTVKFADIPYHGRGFLLEEDARFVTDWDENDIKSVTCEMVAYLQYVIEKLSNVCLFCCFFIYLFCKQHFYFYFYFFDSNNFFLFFKFACVFVSNIFFFCKTSLLSCCFAFEPLFLAQFCFVFNFHLRRLNACISFEKSKKPNLICKQFWLDIMYDTKQQLRREKMGINLTVGVKFPKQLKEELLALSQEKGIDLEYKRKERKWETKKIGFNQVCQVWPEKYCRRKKNGLTYVPVNVVMEYNPKLVKEQLRIKCQVARVDANGDIVV